jgi:hypothetical protein
MKSQREGQNPKISPGGIGRYRRKEREERMSGFYETG